jgi:hypothetical protein
MGDAVQPNDLAFSRRRSASERSERRVDRR